MTIINFAITEPLAKKITKTIKEWGFSSKAEFFRFIAIDFIDRHERKKFAQDPEIAYLSDQLGKAIEKKFKNKTIPSLEEQLEDLI